MEMFFSSGAGAVMLSFIALVGLVTKLFSDIKINKLLKQSKNMGETKDRQLKQWKFKFENTYRINRGMNNALVYIRKNFSQYRVCGIPIQRLDRINVTLAVVVLLLSVGFAALTFRTDTDITAPISYGFAGVLLAGFMLLWEIGCGTSEKLESIINNIQDFYENTLISRLELGNELRNAETGSRSAEMLQSENKRTKKYTPIHENVRTDEKELRNRIFKDTASDIKEGKRTLSANDTQKNIRAESYIRTNKYVPEGTGVSGQRADSDKMRKEVEYLKQSLDRIAAGREPEYVRPTRKLTEKEEQLIEEFIKEYL